MYFVCLIHPIHQKQIHFLHTICFRSKAYWYFQMTRLIYLFSIQWYFNCNCVYQFELQTWLRDSFHWWNSFGIYQLGVRNTYHIYGGHSHWSCTPCSRFNLALVLIHLNLVSHDKLWPSQKKLWEEWQITCRLDCF